MRTLAIPPVVVVVAVVIARGRRTRRSGRDGLFELLNLMSEERGTEGARHCKLVSSRALEVRGYKERYCKAREGLTLVSAIASSGCD